MILLIDGDGVLADFENSFIKAWKESYPNEFFIPYEKRITPKIVDQYPPNLKKRVDEMYNKKGVFANLPIIKGSREALV